MGPLANYIDYEAFGRDLTYDLNGLAKFKSDASYQTVVTTGDTMTVPDKGDIIGLGECSSGWPSGYVYWCYNVDGLKCTSDKFTVEQTKEIINNKAVLYLSITDNNESECNDAENSYLDADKGCRCNDGAQFSCVTYTCTI